MAWEYGIFTCGHEGRVNIIGPIKCRDYKKKHAFEKLCPDCFEKKTIQDRELKKVSAKKMADELGLPNLVGTPKQIDWADTIRIDCINLFENLDENVIESINKKLYSHGIKIDTEVAINNIFTHLLSIVDANEWIENRTSSTITYILKYLDYADETKAIIEKELKEEKIKLTLESSIYPENHISNLPVEFEIDRLNSKIKLKYIKDQGFIEIVKQLDYVFDSDNIVWTRKISEENGSIDDRSAEVGNKLLNAGFGICIVDEHIRNKAISGIFEKECKRWIYSFKDQLKIKWKGYNEDLYRISKLLPSAKWDNGMVVHPSFYREVEDFSILYKFNFTKEAEELIKKYKELDLQKVKIVPIEN